MAKVHKEASLEQLFGEVDGIFSYIEEVKVDKIRHVIREIEWKIAKLQEYIDEIEEAAIAGFENSQEIQSRLED